ncbi:MAG: capsid assembly protein [Alphaproteobacteria bacterium]
MTDNLIESEEIAHVEETPPAVDAATSRPDNMPDKFWDEESGAVRTDAMVKSYRDLEKKLGGLTESGIPDGPDGYVVEIDGQPFETDEEVNAQLHAAGFTQEQTQKVYELAREKMGPMLAEYAVNLEANAQTEKLAGHFGGKEKWAQLSHQLATWGRANCSEDVYEALSSTYEGVQTLHRMMQSGEPGLGGQASAGGTVSDNSLKEMMNDRRYWRDHDPDFVERVRQGFMDLYPEK